MDYIDASYIAVGFFDIYANTFQSTLTMGYLPPPSPVALISVSSSADTSLVSAQGLPLPAPNIVCPNAHAEWIFSHVATAEPFLRQDSEFAGAA